MEVDVLENKKIIKNKIFRISSRLSKKRKNFLTKAIRKSRFLRRNPSNYKKPQTNENGIVFIDEDS